MLFVLVLRGKETVSRFSLSRSGFLTCGGEVTVLIVTAQLERSCRDSKGGNAVLGRTSHGISQNLPKVLLEGGQLNLRFGFVLMLHC